jgi:xanthine dehydrogenase molybdopterin-binding subunit B
VDDCGNIINPMIVDGQIHGGLTMGLAPALFEEITYDDNGNITGGSFMDYLLPTAMETPNWGTDKTITPSPHHPFGAKGVGESPVGSRLRLRVLAKLSWGVALRAADLRAVPTLDSDLPTFRSRAVLTRSWRPMRRNARQDA